jgi:hypothetical protein
VSALLILVHILAKVVAEAALPREIVLIGIVINIYLPARTAAVLATACDAGKFIIVFRDT